MKKFKDLGVGSKIYVISNDIRKIDENSIDSHILIKKLDVNDNGSIRFNHQSNYYGDKVELVLSPEEYNSKSFKEYNGKVFMTDPDLLEGLQRRLALKYIKEQEAGIKKDTAARQKNIEEIRSKFFKVLNPKMHQ